MSTPLSDEIESAIKRAAAAVKRRSDAQRDGEREWRTSDAVEEYERDIRDELEAALSEMEQEKHDRETYQQWMKFYRQTAS